MMFGSRGRLGRAFASRTSVRGPDGLFVDSFINLTRKLENHPLGDGDQVTIPQKFVSPAYEILDAFIQKLPGVDPEVQRPWAKSSTQGMGLRLRLRIPWNPAPECLSITDERSVTVELDKHQVCPGFILAKTSCHLDVEVLVVGPYYGRPDDYLGSLLWRGFLRIVSSGGLDDLWRKFQKAEAKEGVRFEENRVPNDLRASLVAGINEMASKEIKDYRPRTENIVRDHVHPSLYPYIKGVSDVDVSKASVDVSTANKPGRSDFWGRKYEDSIYQWLPSQFSIDSKGKCKILTYVNNLPREKYPHMYSDLEHLFEVFLPMFEDVYSYIKTTSFPTEEDLEDIHWCNVGKCFYEKPPGLKLRNRELQVITKIVDYELSPGQTFDGEWHVEGMSHENIVATGLYIIERSDSIQGGDLLFKRPFLLPEARKIYNRGRKTRHMMVDKIVSEGQVPLGKLETKEHSTIVFPNSHVHKVDTLVNSGERDGYRRIVAFCLVNPEVDIVSSRDVKAQQGVIDRESALQHRLKLMEERKRRKQDRNNRTIKVGRRKQDWNNRTSRVGRRDDFLLD